MSTARLEHSLSLAGAQKAAVLILALGEERGAKLFESLHEEEIREISAAMAQLGRVSADMVEAVCREFTEQAGGGDLTGNLESTERLLLKLLPREKASFILEEIRGPAGRTMWDKLANVNEAVLAAYLRNEYPQTIAVILSRIKSDHAARVLALLPEGIAIDVILRMLRMEAVPRDVMEGVEKTLRAEFMANLSRSSRRDAHEAMAEIFNNLDRRSEQRFMTALETRNEDSAERIKSLMFTFDDLSRLTGPAVQVLLRAAPKDKLPFALKGASEAIRKLVFSNLPERAAKMLREDIEALGPVRVRDVEEAQVAIVAIAKDLAQRGEIAIADRREEAMID